MPDPIVITNYKNVRYRFPTHHTLAGAMPNANNLALKSDKSQVCLTSEWRDASINKVRTTSLLRTVDTF
jgi:hypothetical protein